MVAHLGVLQAVPSNGDKTKVFVGQVANAQVVLRALVGGHFS